MEQAPKPAEPTKPKSKKTMYAAVGAIVVIVVIVLALYLSGIFGTGSSSPGVPITIFDTGTCTGANNCGFTPTPQTVSIATNAKVTWTSNSTTTHTVTACSSANSSAGTPPNT